MNKHVLCYYCLAIFANSLLVVVLGQNDCIDESFELQPTPSLPFIVNQLTVVINSALRVKQGLQLPGGVTELEYAKKCANKFRFVIKSTAGAELSTHEFNLQLNSSLDSLLFQLPSLQPLTEYNVDVYYIQSGPSGSSKQPVFGYTQRVYTCFDNPTKPRNLSLKMSGADGSGVLSWDAPEESHSPRLCYYTVYKRNQPGTQQQVAKLDSNMLSHVISREVIESSNFIGVNAINDISCFANLAFAQKCESPRGNFAEYQIIPTTTQRPTTTAQRPTTTTSIQNSSSRLSFSLFTFFLLPLLAFIY